MFFAPENDLIFTFHIFASFLLKICNNFFLIDFLKSITEVTRDKNNWEVYGVSVFL